MLTPPKAHPPRSLRRERRLWHDIRRYSPPLGCQGCFERAICGSLAIGRDIFSCLHFCCRQPERCDSICRHHPDFALRVREIGGFELENVPRAMAIEAPTIPAVIPMIFHRASRTGLFAPAIAALSLYQLFRRRDGTLRFQTRDAMLEGFGLSAETKLVLSGTAPDAPIESWWRLSRRRREVIRQLRDIGIALATTPNYSLFVDQPRWNDLHAMKRIALVHEEFLSEGLPCALHVNARTETDMRRWSDYIAARSEITHVAYEFTTGTGWADRQEVHAGWLIDLAREVRRPLHLVVRGGLDTLPALAGAFAQITLIETSIFMRTMKRRRAVITTSGNLKWEPALTSIGTPLDDLLSENHRTVGPWLQSLLIPPVDIKRSAVG
jgi:hypothetical protein